MKRLPLFLSMFVLVGGIASAQKSVDIPNVISYQGLLASTGGNPLADGDYPITVTLYGNENGSDAVWHDTYMVAVRGGVFSIYLGSGMNPLPAPDKMNKALWVGTQMAGAEEMRPLTRLSATPYAINVPDNSITEHKIADGAVTASKVDMNYIAGVTVNGKEIVGKGTVLKIQGGKDISVNYDDATQSIVIGAPEKGGREVGTDEKKGDRALQVSPPNFAWALAGNGVDVPSGISVSPSLGDFIGTSGGGIDVEVWTSGTPIMRYQLRGIGTANVVGGDVGNSVSPAAIGNVIAGGGQMGGTPNIINGDEYNTISGGEGHLIDNSFSNHDVIGGGQANTIGTTAVPASWASIGGGQNNVINADFGTIGGGIVNQVTNAGGTVGGGLNNQAAGTFSTVGGGTNNFASLNNSTIGGGQNNVIQASVGTIAGGENNSVFANHSFIGGGNVNQVNAPLGVIGGGDNNAVFADHGFVGGGNSNQLQGPFSVIVGGGGNQVQGMWCAVGGGLGNIVGVVNQGVIAGGLNNNMQGLISAIGGGELNSITQDHSTIGGGISNQVNGQMATVGGGEQNIVNAERSTIGGGTTNFIGPNGGRSVIAGGEFNQITVDRSAIVGGSNNKVFGTRGFIGGGENNAINGNFNNSVIAGGFGNSTSAPYTFTGGGFSNTNDGIESVIGGGRTNVIQPGVSRSFIGGGGNNQILANLGRGVAASIVGGDNLIAQSYGQTVIGVTNIAKGNLLPGAAPNNDPIFIIGNGTAGLPSQAFEVSYNGHSSVFGAAAGAPARRGTTYTDNVIYSWGEVTAAGARNCDFGVQNVARLGPGWYRITMALADQNGLAVNVQCGSVTATLNSNTLPGASAIHNCRFIRATRINGTVFDVFISQNQIIGGVLNCIGVDDNFDFKVTARP